MPGVILLNPITGTVNLSEPITGSVKITEVVQVTGTVNVQGIIFSASVTTVDQGNSGSMPWKTVSLSGSQTELLVGGQPVSSANPVPVSGTDLNVSIKGGVTVNITASLPLTASVTQGTDPWRITGSVELSGPITGTVGIANPLTGTFGLSGPITGNVGITGPVAVSNFPSGFDANITGSIPLTGTFGLSGPITGTVGLSGPITGTIGLSGPITGAVGLTGPITGTVGLSSPITGTVGIAGPLTGTFGLSGPITGAVKLTEPVTGTVGLSGPVTGNFRLTEPVMGTSFRQVLLSSSDLAPGVGNIIIPRMPFAEPYVIINVKGPVDPGAVAKFWLDEVDPLDPNYLLWSDDFLIVSGTGVWAMEAKDANSDTMRLYYQVTGSFTGVNATVVGRWSGNAIEGQTQDGNAWNGEGALVIGGIDGNGNVYPIQTELDGRLKVSIAAAGGNKVTIRNQGNIASNAARYVEYVVPALSSSYDISTFYVGGDGGPIRGTLAAHTSGSNTVVPNGDMESALEVSKWAPVAGTFASGSPDSNATQEFNGSFSMRWAYASSATALSRKQTFTGSLSSQDFSSYRYLAVRFFNDPNGTVINRTITVTLFSGTPTRIFTFAFTAGAGLPANQWTELLCDLDNPSSSTGTGFDITAITAITLQMQDSANRSGIIYWDYVTLNDLLDVRHRLYSSAGQSAVLNLSPAESFSPGQKIYVIVRNLGNTSNQVGAVAAGVVT